MSGMGPPWNSGLAVYSVPLTGSFSTYYCCKTLHTAALSGKTCRSLGADGPCIKSAVYLEERADSRCSPVLMSCAWLAPPHRFAGQESASARLPGVLTQPSMESTAQGNYLELSQAFCSASNRPECVQVRFQG